MVTEAFGKFKFSDLSLVYQPFGCGSFVVYFDDEEFSLFYEEGFVPAFVADASDEHPSFTFSVVESPISYRLHLVEISTVSLVDPALVDQPYADCVLTAILDHPHLANRFLPIGIYWLFADDLMEVTIVLDLLYSQIVNFKL